MRPVNLLPASERVAASGSRPGSSYAVLGVLVVLLVGVVAYVLTANQVTSKKDELAAVTQEAQATQAKVAALGSFGNFASIKQTREQSVAQLAQARLDWERLMRELARVLPADVFLSNLDAAATASADAAGGSSGGSSDATAGSSGPTLKLAGCAPGHRDVATLMVRLRRLTRARDVNLTDSTSVEAAGGSGSGGGCGRGSAFTVSVVFDPAPATALEERVPAHLGGGS